ncbi:Uncharacterized protein DBV15_10868 [Temnothorax longispinosus]|uniref:Mutator-like transposase domain-containing protein n=1 Tax=Temnothorax longispinosus TaxID=300112 RepID=A0A4S2JTF3_9HYME|nr:Uncharacterized protein DBV15_10868 [Temnothorax longispinosus]
MIDTGIGEVQVNTFLSALDIHPVSKSLLKRHERDAGLAIERLAKESCQKSIQLERQLTIASERSNFPTVNSSNVDQSAGSKFDELSHNDTEEMRDWPTDWSGMVPLKASYDAGWQKRGTGHCYNSLTGHGSLIGYYSGLVLAYATRTKKCTMCEKGHEPSDHDCRLNFDRSAKAMEPDMAVSRCV